MKTVAQLKRGESGTISAFRDMDSAMKLMEVGLLPGSKIKIMRTTPFGGPVYLKFGQSYLALRLEEADNILLEA